MHIKNQTFQHLFCLYYKLSTVFTASLTSKKFLGKSLPTCPLPPVSFPFFFCIVNIFFVVYICLGV